MTRPPTDGRPSEWTTVLTARPGGVMTDEVGVITGSVEIASTVDDTGHAVARIRYEGAGEWYTMSDVARAISGPDALAGFHREVVDHAGGA